MGRRGKGGGGGGGRRKVEDVNQKDGFVLFFVLAFHIFLLKRKQNSINIGGSVGFHIINLKYQLFSPHFRDLEIKTLIDMI